MNLVERLRRLHSLAREEDVKHVPQNSVPETSSTITKFPVALMGPVERQLWTIAEWCVARAMVLRRRRMSNALQKRNETTAKRTEYIKLLDSLAQELQNGRKN